MRIRFATIFIICISFWVACMSQVFAQNAPTVLKLAHSATADQPTGKAMIKFAELVEAKTGGKVKIETHLAGSLYAERTAIEALVTGAVDLAGCSNGNWGAFTNTLIFMDLPYVFRTEESFRKVIDGPVGNEIIKKFEKEGFKLLMQLDNAGFRDLVNTKKEIRVPSDVKGLKIRTTASPVEIAMFKNWGAIATAIDWAETYNAISSKVVDGEFVMPIWLAAAKHYEVLKYATENKAVIGIQTLTMKKDVFDKLPKATQEAIMYAAQEAQLYNNEIDRLDRERARAYAASLGVKTYKPTDAEMEVWRSTGREIWSKFDAKVDKQLLKMILDAQEN